MENIEIIRKACIAANPGVASCGVIGCNGHHIKLTLADVLLAISNKNLRFLDNTHLTLLGTLCLKTGNDIYWNLRNDDLTSQSPETLAFLADLLAHK